MQLKPRSSRFVALFTGLVLVGGALVASPSQAAEKSKKLKYGAIALGVVGAYMLSKGKTVPAAVAAAGGYYAYKKSGKERADERNGSYRNDKNRYGYNPDRYGYNPDRNSGGDVYPDDNYSGYRGNATVRQPKPSRNYDLSPYLR